MSFALSNVANYAYMNYIAQQNKSANTSNNIGFTNILSTKSVANTAKAEQSFEDMWKSRFPGSYYHTMDASYICFISI